MLFSYNELKRLANLTKETTVEDVAKAINTIGFEVEEYNKFTDVEGIKFGRILEITKNPNADKLNVCRIQFEDGERTIQTNATNVKENTTVIAFVPGSRLGEITFGAKELKGIMSEGMLSAPSEFGIDKDLFRPEIVAGITTYDVEDLSIDPIEHLGLDDYIIDVDILSNRSDANSYYVMASEIAAYFGTTPLAIEEKESTFESTVSVKENDNLITFVESSKDFEISIQDQILLTKHNVKSISDIVDLTNLTLIYTGQPTHAYDAEKVGEEFSSESFSGKEEVFGAKEVEFNNNLVITSDDKPVSVAGVIGFENTGVSEETKDFILEFGIFDIKEVRKSVKTVKLNTAASSQSSKIISQGTLELAYKFVSSRLNNFSNLVNAPQTQSKEIAFDINNVNALAGSNISESDKYQLVMKSLSVLGFEFKGDVVSVPAYRHDVNHQQDLVEEIFRFYGYDNFVPQAIESIPFKIEKVDPIDNVIPFLGYSQVWTYSLVSEKLAELNPFGFEESVKLSTFFSKEREFVRNSQVASLLTIADYHSKRKIEDINIFSTGMINDGFKTVSLLSSTKSFIQMKQDVVNLIPSNVTFERLQADHIHPNASAKILLDGKMIGWIGKVHPKFMDSTAFVAEFLELPNKSDFVFEDYSQNPIKFRDITIDVEKGSDSSEFVNKLSSFNFFNVKTIAKFEKGGVIKTTFRVEFNEDRAEELEQFISENISI